MYADKTFLSRAEACSQLETRAFPRVEPVGGFAAGVCDPGAGASGGDDPFDSLRSLRAGFAGADDEEMVSFNDVVEWFLLSPLSVREMPHLEIAVPGFTAALVRWMMESTYSGPE